VQFPSQTLNEVILWRLGESGREVAWYADAGRDARGEQAFRPVYYAESRRTILGLAAALRARGLAEGERVAILCGVRGEWMQCDFANLLARLVTVGIYPNDTKEQVQYILQHSGARLLFVESARHLRPIVEILNECKDLQLVVGIDDDCTDDAPLAAAAAPEGSGRQFLSLSALVDEGAAWMAAHGEPAVLDEARRAAPDDLVTIVYTSGTTGPPKGAMLTHRNLFHVSDAVLASFPFRDDDRGIVYLPLAHILQRYTVYLGLRTNSSGWMLSDVNALPAALPLVRPTILAAVPRVLEKIHARAMARIEELTGVRKAVFHWAMGVGAQVSALRRQGREPEGWLLARHRVADRLVLSKIRERLGGAVRFIVSGGAPLSRHLSEWFHAAGLLVIEGYGLTETSAPATTNTPDAFRFGTVGRAISGTEIRIAEDGEVLIRGPGVFTGYWHDEGATRAAFTDDGFFRSGDIGELDDAGYLRITDRKKELIITAAGKNIAPSGIENLLKEHRLVGQAALVGDRRPFLVGLLTLDPDEAPAWAEEHGRPGRTVEELSRDPELLAELERHVSHTNAKLARFETVKRWTLLPLPFSTENGYLTPTLKLKRRRIVKDFSKEIEGLYEGAGAGAA
jgi:long-chain acyl-CoA synthetase